MSLDTSPKASENLLHISNTGRLLKWSARELQCRCSIESLLAFPTSLPALDNLIGDDMKNITKYVCNQSWNVGRFCEAIEKQRDDIPLPD